MLTVRAVIDALGGPAEVGEICRISAPAVSNWGARDVVAAEHRITIWRLAQAKGLDWKPPGADGLCLAESADGGRLGVSEKAAGRRCTG